MKEFGFFARNSESRFQHVTESFAVEREKIYVLQREIEFKPFIANAPVHARRGHRAQHAAAHFAVG